MKKVLAISEDGQLLGLLSQKISTLGLEMDTLSPSDNMLETIKSFSPDVVVLDFILGDENAAAICHQITSGPDTQDIPVIILSDYPGIEEIGAKTGSFAVIKKPMPTEELAEEIIAAIIAHQQA